MRSIKISKNRMYVRLASKITLVLMFILSFAFILSMSTATFAAEGEGIGGTPYTTDYESQDEVYNAANEFNKLLVAEGIVLLKNDDDTLPLATGSKLNVFGKNSAEIAIGGTGSSTGSGSVEAEKMVSLYDSLTMAGFEINPELVDFYEDDALSGGGRVAPNMGANLTGLSTGETPLENYPQSLIDTYASYDDAAVFVITRIGGEGYDLPTTMLSGGEAMPGSAEGDHYLELDLYEKALLASLQADPNINDIIIIVNASQQMELGFLNDSVNYSKIKAAIWVGGPGQAGVESIGKVLNGEVNPSGHLVDTYAADFTTDPVWYNFARSGNQDTYGTVSAEGDFTAGNRNFVDYEEGIYLGYRYWETRGFDENDDWAWYDEHVVYPFGYGLSYTTFSWSLVSSDIPATLAVDSEISFTIEVENTGTVAGKDVVQLYYTAPYFDGGIEKSYVKLGDFAKTSLLAPGAKDEVTLTLSLKDMAAYDYNDANGNGFKGFELEGGTYTLRFLQNANARSTNGVADVEFDVPVLTGTATAGATGIQFPNDEVTGHAIENLFDDVSQKAINGTLADTDTQAVKDSGGFMNVMTRASGNGGLAGTIPTGYPTEAERTVSSEFMSSINAIPGSTGARETADAGSPWYRDTFPTQAEDDQGEVAILLRELIGLSYDDRMWDLFMNQMTYEEMAYLIGHGSFHTVAIPRLGKPWSIELDGPVGLVPRQTTGDIGYPSSHWEQNERATVYATQPVVAATWNKDLVFEYGEMTGEEGIWGNTAFAYSGIYAPGLNIHRSPFSGRNFEYYSEDGVLSGIMGAQFSKGAESKGLYVMMKHYFLNDQETNRNGITTWADEQTMREIYLLPFEKTIKVGNARGAMASFNSIGAKWSGASHALNIDLTRDEWGFEGMIITDWGSFNANTQNWMVRTGVDLFLGGSGEGTLYYEGDDLTATHAWALRRASKAIMFTVANSNAMIPRLGFSGDIEVTDFLGGSPYTLDLSGAATNYELETPPTITYSASNLPAGLTLDPTTGIITGTVEISYDWFGNQNSPTSYTFTITASVEPGSTVNTSVSKEITINQATAIQLPTINSGYVGVEYFSDAIQFTPSIEAELTYELDPGVRYGDWVITPGSTLPEGLVLNDDGTISGVPTTEVSNHQFTVLVSAPGFARQSLVRTISILPTLDPNPVLTFENGLLTAGQVGEAYSATFSATGATGITFASSDLPAGLSLSAAGALTGTPTEAGVYMFTVTASAEGSEDVDASFVLEVAPEDVVVAPVIVFEDDLLTAGQVGEAYSATFSATGATGITFASSDLPAGLTLNEDGTLSGTPTEAGVYMFTVTASAEGSEDVEASFALNIAEEGSGFPVVVPIIIIGVLSLVLVGAFILRKKR